MPPPADTTGLPEWLPSSAQTRLAGQQPGAQRHGLVRVALVPLLGLVIGCLHLAAQVVGIEAAQYLPEGVKGGDFWSFWLLAMVIGVVFAGGFAALVARRFRLGWIFPLATVVWLSALPVLAYLHLDNLWHGPFGGGVLGMPLVAAATARGIKPVPRLASLAVLLVLLAPLAGPL